jgi:hypothetical protein
MLVRSLAAIPVPDSGRCQHTSDRVMVAGFSQHVALRVNVDLSLWCHA